jgi:hypothetical protein
MRGNRIDAGCCDQSPVFAASWLALSLPPAAPAFEDRGVPTGIARSPEPFEAKPLQKKFDYNYS